MESSGSDGDCSGASAAAIRCHCGIEAFFGFDGSVIIVVQVWVQSRQFTIRDRK